MQLFSFPRLTLNKMSTSKSTKLQQKFKKVRVTESWEHLTENLRKTVLNVFLFKKWTEKFSETETWVKGNFHSMQLFSFPRLTLNKMSTSKSTKLQQKFKKVRVTESWEHLTENLRKTVLNVFLFKKWTEKFSETETCFKACNLIISSIEVNKSSQNSAIHFHANRKLLWNLNCL